MEASPYYSCCGRGNESQKKTYDADGRVVNVFALDIADGLVQAIRSVVNPDKLGHLGPVSDLARLPEKD